MKTHSDNSDNAYKRGSCNFMNSFKNTCNGYNAATHAGLDVDTNACIPCRDDKSGS